MNDTTTPPADPAEWALVEIFGHRRHYGRIAEVERFGAKMLRVDVPGDEPDAFTAHFYGGASIFSITPCTEETARAHNDRYRPRPVMPLHQLPPPIDDGADEETF